MSKTLIQHIKKISANDNATTNATKMNITGTRLSSDIDPVVHAYGGTLLLMQALLPMLLTTKP